MRTLRSRIIWQFAAIVAPFALVLAYQTFFDIWRIQIIAAASRNADILEKTNQLYKPFVNGIVDAVDSGTLSGNAANALTETRIHLETNAIQGENQAAVLAILERIKTLEPAIAPNMPIDHLVPHRGMINEINTSIAKAVVADQRERASIIETNIAIGRLNAGVVVFAAILSIWIAAYFVSQMVKNLTIPLQRAVDASRGIASGKVTDPISTDDDIDGLNHSIERMRQAIEKSQGALLEIQRGLERKVEERTRDLTLATERAEKLAEVAQAANAAKSQFLANMSHEIRTPMNGVLGMTQVLMSSDLSPKQQGFVNNIYRSGERLLSILNDILDFSKIEAGKLEIEKAAFNLHQSVRDVIALHLPHAESKAIELNWLIAPDVPAWVIGDQVRTTQIVNNLISNAIKFTNSGSVLVSLRLADKSDIKDPRTYVAFEVRDTGIGIAPEELSRLFQAFSQADSSTTRKYGGSGLGLAISKNLVEIMGGTLAVTSQPDIGSTFGFVLPIDVPNGEKTNTLVARSSDSLDAAGNPPAENLRTVTGEAPYRGRHLLLAEDDDVNVEIASSMLAAMGFTITVAANGREAVDLIEHNSFDLVLMDCHMPVMDGYDATREIRSCFGSSITVIAMTANAMTGDRERCIAAGMNDYISKPVRRQQLREMVEKWLEGDATRSIAHRY